MNKKNERRATLAMFVGYVWLVTMAGLALHPYRSVRNMVFERAKRILLPVALSPTVALVVFFIVGRVGSRMFELTGMAREVVALVLGWSLIGLLMWQGLILVLVWRFWRGYRA